MAAKHNKPPSLTSSSSKSRSINLPNEDLGQKSNESLSNPYGDSRSSSVDMPRDPSPAVLAQGALDKDLEKQTRPESDHEDERPQRDPNLIDWDGPDDPENPMNWSKGKKWLITCTLASMTWVITFASSVFSTATVVTARKFGVSNEVMILGTSLFILGFAFGPILWGPLSELYGRKKPLFFGFFVFGIFQIPVAVAQNLQTIMICRFLGGFFGCAPLAIIGGALADFWDPVERGIAVCIFAAATFIGPVAGPIVGGFITMSHLGWRWTEYITAIMAFFFGTIAFFIVPETLGSIILQDRAYRIRHETKNWAVHAQRDEVRVDVKALLQKYLVKPFVMLFLEPILMLITLYIALVYAIIYLFFEAYPIAFQEVRHWNDGVGALPFLGITLGVLLGSAIIYWFTITRFAAAIEKHGRVVPEERLVPMMIGGILLPIGLFWFGWTSNPHVSWVPQVLAGIPSGAGILLIFLCGLNYIIDVYLMHANSALAGNTFVRSFLAAAFPLFATAMYHTLGVNWASSLLGFLTVAMAPVPFLFYIYGARIRKMSRFSPKMG